MAGLGHVAADAKGTKDEACVQDAPGRGRDARKPRDYVPARPISGNTEADLHLK